MPDREPDEGNDEVDEQDEAVRLRELLELERMRVPEVNTPAVASLILGLSAMACFGLLTGLPALFAGLVGLSRAQRQRGGGRTAAIIGMVAGAVGIAWSSAWLYANVLAVAA